MYTGVYTYRRILEYIHKGGYWSIYRNKIYTCILEYIQEQDLYINAGVYTYRRILEYIHIGGNWSV